MTAATSLAVSALRLRLGRRRAGAGLAVAPLAHEVVELGAVLGHAQPLQERAETRWPPPPAGAAPHCGIRRRRGCRWGAAPEGHPTAACAAPSARACAPTARPRARAIAACRRIFRIPSF